MSSIFENSAMQKNILAVKSGKKSVPGGYVTDIQGNIYRKVATLPRVAGKVKEYIQNSKIMSRSVRSNFNGYGYQDVTVYYFCTKKQISDILSMTGEKKAKKEKGDPVDSWAKRLSKITGISIEEALIIAEEKIEYKEQCIRNLEYRDAHAPSVKREQLINQIKRSNPLRYIKDSEHASNILTASSRHNGTDYEQQLDYARGLAASGEIEKNEIKEYARAHSVTFAN